jgi:putative glutamine amidotransferase
MGVGASYVEAVEHAGGLPLLIPAGRPTDELPWILEMIDGLLLPGGVDVQPAVYGEADEPGLRTTDPELDALEVPLVQAAVPLRIPVLGICRGAQLINVAYGGSLSQDISKSHREVLHWSSDELGPGYLAHDIEVITGTLLHEIVKEKRLAVNSFHHQAVKRMGLKLIPNAMSADGLIEGFESNDGRVLSVQCHPEDLTDHEWSRGLFAWLVRAAGETA